MGNVFSDELGEDRSSGAMLLNGLDDVPLGRGRLVDPEVLGDEPVGRTAACHHSEEARGGHILHGGEDGRPRAGGNQLG